MLAVIQPTVGKRDEGPRREVGELRHRYHHHHIGRDAALPQRNGLGRPVELECRVQQQQAEQRDAQQSVVDQQRREQVGGPDVAEADANELVRDRRVQPEVDGGREARGAFLTGRVGAGEFIDHHVVQQLRGLLVEYDDYRDDRKRDEHQLDDIDPRRHHPDTEIAQVADQRGGGCRHQQRNANHYRGPARTLYGADINPEWEHRQCVHRWLSGQCLQALHRDPAYAHRLKVAAIDGILGLYADCMGESPVGQKVA
ncbi:hypothetical protein DFQ30_009638 [Apophysomyces sp. BC1015]|nr:hypothetical protein DFQ30_009638 [Apophysomyces sp. BC1015]